MAWLDNPYTGPIWYFFHHGDVNDSMKALLLCAGRGERLRPLTDLRPKPLIDVGGRALVEHHLFALADAGFNDVVINLAYKGRMIERMLGSGSRYGLSIEYSREGKTALESGGAIAHAKALLGDDPFMLVNGDIYCSFPFAGLRHTQVDLAHLVLVPNPDHNPEGDFALTETRLLNDGYPRYTYAGVALFDPRIISEQTKKRFSIVPALRAAADNNQATGEYFEGTWVDVGTEDRLAQARSIASQA